MHPHVKEREPGTCPRCGMTMQAESLIALDRINQKYQRILSRFFIAAFFSMPTLFLASGSYFGFNYVSYPISGWLQFIFSSIILFLCGWPFFINAVKSIATLQMSPDILIVIGTSAGWLYSTFTLLYPDLLPQSISQQDGSTALYFETVSVIIMFALLGQVFEIRARVKAANSIRTLLNLTPQKARRINESGQSYEVSVEHIIVDDVLRVESGERIPVDGDVIKGFSHVNESMLTGESRPVRKESGDKVFAGSFNETGHLIYRATAVGRDTKFSQLVELIFKVLQTKKPLSQILDKFLMLFVPFVIFCSFLTFCFWFYLDVDKNLAFAMTAAITVLIIACPCAIGIASSMPIMAGIDQCANLGILIESFDVFDRVKSTGVVVFDKTGTLTRGAPVLTSVFTIDGLDEKEVLSKAAAVEALSQHPIGKAIFKASHDKNSEISIAIEYDETIGAGVTGKVHDEVIHIGNLTYVSEYTNDKASFEKLKVDSNEPEASKIFMLINKKPAAIFIIKDPFRSGAVQVLKDIKALGLDVMMITGDSENIASYTANQLHIEKYDSEVVPDQRHHIINKLKDKFDMVVMVGDGINDAPSLEACDVGIAMGDGSDVALKSADIIIINSRIKQIKTALIMSFSIVKNMKQSIFLAFIYNGVGIAVAAGLFYKAWGIMLSPYIASLAMVLSSVSVILNATWLKFKKIP